MLEPQISCVECLTDLGCARKESKLKWGNFGDAGADRLRKLDEVRREIEKGIANGHELAADEWIQKYPGLNPELGELLAELIAVRAAAATIDGATHTAIFPTIGTALRIASVR